MAGADQSAPDELKRTETREADAAVRAGAYGANHCCSWEPSEGRRRNERADNRRAQDNHVIVRSRATAALAEAEGEDLSPAPRRRRPERALHLWYAKEAARCPEVFLPGLPARLQRLPVLSAIKPLQWGELSVPRRRHRCSCRQHMAQLSQARTYQARLWEERRAAGLCGMCGLTEAEGRAICTDCRKVRSAKALQKTKRNRRFHRRLRGAA